MSADNGSKPVVADQPVAAPAEPVGAVMIVGAGITGIQASLDLAESGFKVYLVDSSPVIGGRMAQLDKTFPTGDCAMCILSPKLVECARNKNIEIITMADVQGISGTPGNFKVKLRQNPRYVDLEKCNACGDCVEACPVDLPNEFDRRLGTRKAIFRAYPQAIPNVFGISKAPGRAPCRSSCPSGINVQGYVALIAAGKFHEAYDLIQETCPFPAACGRICPHPCETACTRGSVDEPIAIASLKRYAFDHGAPADLPEKLPVLQEERVAIVGGGPAGLSCARDLAKYRLRHHRLRGAPSGRRHAARGHPRLPHAPRRSAARDRHHLRAGCRPTPQPALRGRLHRRRTPRRGLQGGLPRSRSAHQCAGAGQGRRPGRLPDRRRVPTRAQPGPAHARGRSRGRHWRGRRSFRHGSGSRAAQFPQRQRPPGHRGLPAYAG